MSVLIAPLACASQEVTSSSACLDWLVRRRDKQTVIAGPTRIVNDEPIFPVADVARARNHSNGSDSPPTNTDPIRIVAAIKRPGCDRMQVT